MRSTTESILKIGSYLQSRGATKEEVNAAYESSCIPVYKDSMKGSDIDESSDKKNKA